MNPIDRFKAMLEAGEDNALLRLTLGNAYLAQGQAADAVLHLRAAVTQDPNYSAAWKALGKALEDTQALADASDAYARGIAVAQQRGDLQAAREMQVFHKRVLKKLDQEPPTDA